MKVIISIEHYLLAISVSTCAILQIQSAPSRHDNNIHMHKVGPVPLPKLN